MEVIDVEIRKPARKSAFGQFKEHFEDPVYKNKFICTLFLFWAFLVMGFAAGQSGPSFLDLMLITNTKVEQASALFTSGAVGFTVGAFVSGFLYDKCNKLLLMAACLVGSSIFSAVIPLCTPLPAMIAMYFLRSFVSAGVETGGNTDLMRLWGKDSRVFMQILHFSFALGGLVAPLATEPFLAPKSVHTTITTVPVNESHFLEYGYNTTKAYVQDSFRLNGTSNNITTAANEDAPKSQILFAFIITAVLFLSAALPFFVEFSLRKADKSRKPEDEQEVDRHCIPTPVYVITVSMIGAFFFCYIALEETFMSFLAVFTVEGLGWTKPDGALVTSVFWGSFAAFRFLGIFFIKMLTPSSMIILCLVILSASLGAFLVCSLFAVTIGIWISSVGIGLATSIVYPTTFTWVEEHVIKVTGRVTSVIVICAASGGMATPLLLGYLMEEVTYMWFSYLMFLVSVILLIIYIMLRLHSGFVLKKYHRAAEAESPNELATPQEKGKMFDPNEHVRTFEL
ncbi:sodium-dependent glucose transporter 1A-like [Haliotis cracherodii]|uniref:sodium-dependent glucose transporter 1A-like n=1 Tax=Haliotis cracherodii TaxID=6455 RepID=UPI0039E87F74